jgi:MFS family permease
MCCDATQLILYSIIVCTNSVYSLASLFLPTVFKEKDIPGFWTGLVFSMYSIAVVIVSPFVGTMINKVGFANIIAIGLVLMGAAIIPIGHLNDIGDDWTTLGVGIFLRAL